MSQEMSPTDWSTYIDDWRDSFDEPNPQTTPDKKRHLPLKERKKKARKNTEGKAITYTFQRVMKQTPKAKFFVTNVGIAGTFGFWCPKAAIVNQDDLEGIVEIADWCDITEIEYT